MTQEELSEGIVSLSYLSKIENQKTNASPEILQLLCDRLGIEISEDTDIEEKCKQKNSYKSLTINLIGHMM